MQQKSGLTTMMRQYLEIKEQHKDCIVFFRLGDFYEMFFDDAKTASRELELTLTGRNCGLEERAPMCGVPFHSAQGYIAKLVKKGYKVAICEQMEDPSVAKDIVKREVIRIITPGTANMDAVLSGSDNNYLAVVYIDDHDFGVCFTDVSTGEMFCTEGRNDMAEARLINVLACFSPTEIVVNDKAVKFKKLFANLKNKFNFYMSYYPDSSFDEDMSTWKISEKFGMASESTNELSDRHFAKRAVGASLKFLNETQKVDLSHINKVSFYLTEEYMEIDASSRRNLEITETLRDKTKKGSLLGILDKTKTSMGSRLIKKWVEQPLIDSKEINLRLDAVEELEANPYKREELAGLLRGITDIERIISKIVYQSANARDFVSLKNSIRCIPDIISLISDSESDLIKNIHSNFDPLDDIYKLIDSAFVEDAPITIKEGGMIKAGFDAKLDSLREIAGNSASIIAEIEGRERETTGIKNLKVSYNKVFGYYIEISKSNIDKAPDHYIRKQTLTNCERYITQELKELESTILGAKEKIFALEYEDFTSVRNAVFHNIERLQLCAKLISVLDAVCALATVASNNNYVRPTVDNSDIVDIRDGRHPIVEVFMTDSLFVPNDTYLDTDENRFAIITGPNMAGKSTYMRQTAIICLMAQIGSFVPASYCHVGVVDKIFTRVGASDDLAAGQSTFMVEMNEVANILKNATRKSLLILDEIGRGTSTFDGLSIAWAVVEYLSDSAKIGAKSLFATHYHELTALENSIQGVKNYSILVKKKGDDIAFLRKIVKGGTDDSFGIEVAKLAGVPDEVTDRAKDVLRRIENGEIIGEYSVREEKQDGEKLCDDIVDTIKNYDVSTLTPIEALNEIYKLQKKVCKLYGEN